MHKMSTAGFAPLAPMAPELGSGFDDRGPIHVDMNAPMDKIHEARMDEKPYIDVERDIHIYIYI